MAVVVDFNQVAVANVMQQANAKRQIVAGEQQLRLMILETLRKYRKMFRDDGHVVIAVDGRASWRKAVFPHYKFRRAEDRAKNAPTVNWTEFYRVVDQLANDISMHFPYTVIRHEQAEGDDIIGEVVRWYHENRPMESILILSGDKDFKQLHYSSRIKQYSPTLEKFVYSAGAEQELREIIIKGDRLDGVPNIFSPGNSFVTRTKQKKVTAGRLQEYSSIDPEQIEDPQIKANFVRNTILVDLNKTPGSIKESIRNQLEQSLSAPKYNNIFNYIYENQLVELLPRAGDF